MRRRPAEGEPLRANDRRILKGLEHRMFDGNLRAHIYRTRTTTIAFATRCERVSQPLHRNIGPNPVETALRALLPPADDPRRWLANLWGPHKPEEPGPAPALWDTPHLVVTGVMPRLALCMALQHESEYPATVLEQLRTESEMTDDDELRRLYEDLTWRELGS